MKINNLTLKNFRNYNNLEIVFNDNLNIIIGNNAQGKTNILEAIYYLSITKPININNDKNLIMKDKLGASIKALIKSKEDDNELLINIANTGKKLVFNNNEIKKHSDFIGKLKVILFTPDSLRIIKDGPSNRRRFLNIDISQLYVKYINYLNEYNIILKQRNEYLKSIKNNNYNEVYLEILNSKFIDLAVNVYKYRLEYINCINKYVDKIFENISGYKGLSLKYITNISLDDMGNVKKLLYDKIDSLFEKEVIYGSTLVGPHRDDFSFKADNIDLLLYGSQGQQKMAVLALKLAEIDVFMDICSEYPVLLLDDLFSELDVDKRNKVISYLNRDIQTIVTTTDIDNINDEIINEAYVFKINNGEVMTDNYKTIEKGT